jgi:hypothetical protein
MNLTLTRIAKPGATFGVLSTDDFPLCVTLELPWLDNQPDISCIPTGTYHCEQFESPEHGQVWQVMNVLDRSDVLLHEGNYLSNTKGCILCAFQFAGNAPAILTSDLAIAFLRNTLPSEFDLIIVDSQ